MASRDVLRPLTGNPLVRGIFFVSVLVIAIGWALRTLAEAGTLLGVILVPVALSVLFTGVLMPLQVLLNHKLKLPRSLGAALTVVLAFLGVVCVLWVAGTNLAKGTGDIVDAFGAQLVQLRDWAIAATPLDQQQVDDLVGQATTWLQENQSGLAQGAMGAGVGFAGFLVSGVLAMVATFFFLAQGDRIWAAVIVVLFPERMHREAWQASRRGWVTLATYCRTQLLVAAVDALGIGLGAFLLGVPFVIPIMAVTFILCFIPFVGAIVSSALAVAMALAFQGPGVALAMLGVCILVQQVEANVLSPILMGKAVDVHPLLILLSVAGATYVLGLVGALFVVPVIATIKSMVLYLNGTDPFPGLATGGRALLTPPKTLIGPRDPVRSPRRIGDATPRWLVEEQAEEEEAVAEAQRGERRGGSTRA